MCMSFSYRESFPNDLQFTILMRFTVDQAQTLNLKVNHNLKLRVREIVNRMCERI